MACPGRLIAVLAARLALAALFTRRPVRPWASPALVLFGVGAGFLIASLFVDGLLTPAITARYAAVPEETGRRAHRLRADRGLIHLLMPAGLLFQAAGLAVAAFGFWRKDTLVPRRACLASSLP